MNNTIIEWDSTKTLFFQQPATISAVQAALNTKPLNVENELCTGGFVRPRQQVFSINGACNIQVNYTYAYPANSKGFMALTDVVYTLIKL